MAEIQEQDVVQSGPYEGMVPKCFVELLDARAPNTLYLVVTETLTEAKALMAATPVRRAEFFATVRIFPHYTPEEMAAWWCGTNHSMPNLKWEIVEKFPPLPPPRIRCPGKPARTEEAVMAEVRASLRKVRRQSLRQSC